MKASTLVEVCPFTALPAVQTNCGPYADGLCNVSWAIGIMPQ